MGEVMIIDDEVDLLELVKITLEREGHEVNTAESGEEGIEILMNKSADLVLLDINMPGLDGWETLSEMKNKGITEDTPVMMFTVEELTFVKMLRDEIEGLIGYIEKPFEKEELIELVNESIKKTEELREYKNDIRKSPDGGAELAEAYETWGRKKMIHERFLEKLSEMEKSYNDEDKLARINNMKKGERNTIEYLERKKEEVLRTAGLENLIS